jgi:hypothetical protein
MIHNHPFRIASLLFLLLAVRSVGHAQDSPVTGARFTLIEKPEPSLSVTLENLRDVPLVQWEVATVRAGFARPNRVTSFFRTHPGPYAAGDGPVPAHGRRTVSIQLDDADATAVMTLAVFQDGYYEGQAQNRLPVLDRPLTPGPLRRGADVPSMRITSATQTTTGRVYAVVENLRDVAIEAFGLQEYEPGSDRLRSGSTSDFCGVKGAPIGSGPIQPGERREIALSWAKNPDGSLPNVKLHFILFDDKNFEGSSSSRDSLLKSREQRSTNKC